MVVEDSNTQRILIAEFLQSHAFKVLAVKDGAEALKSLQKVQPDLIVLDVEMPNLNGYEVCRRLKANPSTQNLPIIFCSSNSTEAGRYWGLKIGAEAYISKPFRPKDFLETVRSVLSSTGKQPATP